MYYPILLYNKNDFKRPYDPEDSNWDIIQLYSNLFLENENLNFLITGYQETDEQPGIAQKRVNYFKQKLIQKGISDKRITAKVADIHSKAKESKAPCLQNLKGITNNRTILIQLVFED